MFFTAGIGCAAKISETTLETACSSEMNIHLRHLWHCVDETVHFRGALQGLSTCTLGFPPGEEHIKPTNGDTTLTVKPCWANQKTGEEFFMSSSE